MSLNSSDTITLAASSNASGSFPDRGPLVFAVTTGTLALSTLFVAARMVCRTLIVKKVSRDDWLIVVAWTFAFGLSLVIDIGAKHGLGRHDENISADHWDTLRRCEYVFTILYNPALMATKTSILVFYLRLAKHTQHVLRLASWITLTVVNLAGVVLTLLNVFQCRPIAAAWNVSSAYSASRCIPILTEFICAAPVNIVTDLAILALPIPVLTGMRLPPKQKTILVFTFTLGIFVTVVDVVRIYYLQQAVSATPATGLSSDPDALFGGPAQFSWNASLSFMWSAVEVNVGMTCACIPTLKPLVIKLLPKLLLDPNATRESTSSSEKDYADPPLAGVRGAMTFAGVLPSHQQARLPSSYFARSPARSSAHYPPNHAITVADNFLLLATPPLTTPDSESPPGRLFVDDRYLSPRGPSPAPPLSPRSNEDVRAVYFGFVNLNRPKSMLKTSARESFKYCLTVTILFLLWGMSYGLLNILNNVVASISNMSRAETLGLSAIYFGGGYFLGPLLVGEWILRRDEHYRTRRRKKGSSVDPVGGFKVTFIVGLCIYGIGTIIFWPSAVTRSYGGFMLSNFVVGFGVSILETGGNAFIVLCGPSQYGETRALLAQGVQSVGAVVSELMARKAFFRDIAGSTQTAQTESTRLINVQWTYLAITLACVGLALFFYYMPLPETNDNELEEASLHRKVDPRARSFWGWELRTWTLVLAVLAQYTYNAAQETCGIYFQSLLLSRVPGAPTSGDEALLVAANEFEVDHPPELTLATTDYFIIAHVAFAVSRFLTGFLTYLSATRPKMPQPRMILTVSVTMSTCCALAIAVLPRGGDPNLMAIPLVLFYFSQGPIWPLIYGIGLRGQGRRTKRAAAFITMGGSGPAAASFIMYGIVTTGHGIQQSFYVILGFQALVLTYPIFLDVVADARKLVDPRAAMAWLNGSALPTARLTSHDGGDKGVAGGCSDLGIDNLRVPEPTLREPGSPTTRPNSKRPDGGRRDRLVRKATVMGAKLGVVRARTVA